MSLKERIDYEAKRDARFEAMLHGMEIDGGAPGSGVQQPRDQNTYDPTQGTGTNAWQESQRMALQLNAKQRRN